MAVQENIDSRSLAPQHFFPPSLPLPHSLPHSFPPSLPPSRSLIPSFYSFFFPPPFSLSFFPPRDELNISYTLGRCSNSEPHLQAPKEPFFFFLKVYDSDVLVPFKDIELKI